MMEVWKWPVLPLKGQQVQRMPKGAKILHVAAQHDTVSFWALVDPNAEMEARNFYVFGTGWDIPAPLDYVGTAVMDDGLVFHVFEDKEGP